MEKYLFFQYICITFVLGIFFTLSLYHLFVYLGRRKDKSNLSYSLLSILNALYIFSIRIIPLFISDNNLLIRIKILTVILAGLGFAYFAHTVFNLSDIKFYSIIHFFIFLFSGLISIIFIKYKSFIKLFFINALAYPLLFFILMNYIIIKTKQYKEKKKRLIIIGYCLLLLTAVFVNLFSAFLGINAPFFISISPFIIMMIIFAYALTDSFNKEHKDLIDLTNTLEQKVLERTKQLKEATQEKINFFINYAHETKTPLTIIDNNLNIYIKKRGTSLEIEHVKYNVDKLKHNAKNLLDFEKLERNQVFYNHNQVINLSELLNKKILMYKYVAGEKNINIKSIVQNDIYIKIDPSAIDRIINNILDNAIKYNKENGIINILLNTDNKKIILTIKDNGIGISKEQLQNIFKPYYQLSHTKRNIQGIGMGLSIVKKILDEVNGEIKVESEINNGSTFTILFNKSNKKEEEIINDEELEKPHSIVKIDLLKEKYDKSKHTIFIVEDDLEIIELIQKSFYDVYNIFYGINGKDALDKIKKMPVKPHLIISDIMMDVMDGYEFRKELLKDQEYKLIPFIFLTAKTTKQDVIYGYQNEIIGYIKKPFDLEELYLLINNLIEFIESFKNELLNEKGYHDNELLNKFKEIMNQCINSDKENRFNSLCFKYLISISEKKVLSLILKDFEDKEISNKLNLTYDTVRTHVRNIRKKFNIKSKEELRRFFSNHNNELNK